MSEKRKFQLSVKFSGGYDAPMLNVEGDTAEDFQANVAFVVDNVVDIVKAATLFQATYNVEKPQDNPPPRQAAPAAAPPRSWSNSGSQAPAAPAATGQPEGPPPSCSHGDMRWRPPGLSKRTNKAYNGFWACPSPDRQAQCPAVNV